MQKRQFETLKGVRQWGYIYIPEDRTKKYPVVFFCHGLGETGNTESAVTKLLVHGPQKFISGGWRPDVIVVAIQHHSWSFPPDRINYVLSNDPDIKAYGNGKAMITGLSAGGEEVIKFMRLFHNPEKFVYVPMSPASNPQTLPAPPYKIWGFVGNKDTTTGGALRTLTNFKDLYGGRLTVFSGNHCCWNNYYNPAYKEEGKNIYEWAFQEVATEEPVPVPDPVPDPIPDPVPDPIPEPVPDPKTIIAKFQHTVFSDGSFETIKI